MESGVVGFAYVLTIGFSFFSKHTANLEAYAIFQKTRYTNYIDELYKKVCVCDFYICRQTIIKVFHLETDNTGHMILVG